MDPASSTDDASAMGAAPRLARTGPWVFPQRPERVCITVDVEHDCPPFLATYRGITEGLPRLLDLLARRAVRGTFFVTGDVARRYPEAVRAIVAGGHELGCHGDTHRRFGALDAAEARAELRSALEALGPFASPGESVRSFRAPNLDLPEEHVALVAEAGFTLDSSEGLYKPRTLLRRPSRWGPLARVPASITPSATRLPAPLREAAIALLRSPRVLFFHPWEFTDVTREPIPLDCRFATGEPALRALAAVIDAARARGAVFERLRDLPR